MKLTRTNAAGLCLFVVITLWSLGASSAELIPFLKSDVIKRLELDDNQVAKLKDIAEKYAPRIAEAEMAARETPAQTAAREAAIKKAIACGKRGIDAKRIIAAAGRPTKAQAVATQELLRQQNARDESVFAVLTEQQRAKIDDHQIPLGDEFTGFIVVRLASSVPFDFTGNPTLNQVADSKNLTGLTRVLNTFQLNKSSRVMFGISETDFANQTPTSKALFQRLETYWRIDARKQHEQAKQIVGELSQVPEINAAYRELSTRDPGRVSINNPFNSKQGYLNPAPEGIDARFAWTQPNGRGAGIGLADIEHCWNPYHEDLIGQDPLLIHGIIEPGDHGTAVLGSVVAEDNSVGVVGAAPSVDYVFLSSKIEATAVGEHVAEAICRVLRLMNIGDVLLLEVDTGGLELPIEIQELEYDVIRFAVALGIVVVEAAGNGEANLDELQVDEKRILNRNDPSFRDSGAIFVGAGESEPTHNRIHWSNYGSRVDCFAWGHLVVTSGTIWGSPDLSNGGGDPNKVYTTNFNGTSSSAPIVAGAAIILQGMAKANSGVLLSSVQMRAYLANRATGTPQATGTAGNIGVMPDLKAIIQANAVFSGTSWSCWHSRKSLRSEMRRSRRLIR
jgi:hypothetical protein